MDYAMIEEVHAKREAGFNCAEGVFWGVTRSLGLATPVSCVTGFGGGIAGSGSVCGALLGAIAALGVYVGRTEPGDSQGKTKSIELSKAVQLGFTEAMESPICQEILGHLPGTKPTQPYQGINPKCQQAVRVAMELTLRAIERDQQS